MHTLPVLMRACTAVQVSAVVTSLSISKESGLNANGQCTSSVVIVTSKMPRPWQQVVELTVEIQVVQTKLLEGQVQFLLNIRGLVASVPQLASDEELFTFHDGWNDTFQSNRDFFLVIVNIGDVDMPVSGSNSGFDLGTRNSEAIVHVETNSSAVPNSRPHAWPSDTSPDQWRGWRCRR